MNRSGTFNVGISGPRPPSRTIGIGDLLVGLMVCLTLVGCGPSGKDKLIDAGNYDLWRAEYTQAIGKYRRALDYDPGDAEALYKIGLCYNYLGDCREAVYWEQQALKSFPGHKRAQLVLDMAQKKLAEAPDPRVSGTGTPASVPPPAPFPGPVSPPGPVPPGGPVSPPGPPSSPGEPINPPQDPSTLSPRLQAERFIKLGRTYKAAGDSDQALQAYQQAVEVAGDQAFTHAELGRFYVYVGQNDKAIDELQKAHRLNPAEPGVAEDLAKLGVD